MRHFIEILLDVFALETVYVGDDPLRRIASQASLLFPWVAVMNKRVDHVLSLALAFHLLLQFLLDGGVSNSFENLHA